MRGFVDRTCIVCGHNLGPYGRICDKCGSIQRPVAGDGMALPMDRFKTCGKCGNPILIDSPEDFCEPCLTGQEIPQVVWLDDADPHRKSRVIAMISSGVSVLAGVGVALVMIFAGANLLLDIIAILLAVSLGASVAAWVTIRRRPAHRIEHYAPIKPQGQEQAKP